MASFAIILVALSTVGFAYSSWRDSVTVNVNAQMGEFIVGILTDPLPDGWEVPVIVEETTNGFPEGGPAPPPWEEGGFEPKPWVCDTEFFLDDFRTSVHHDPIQTVAHYMKITVDNAYPQYDAHVKFLLKNAGTIPAHIRVHFLGSMVYHDGEYLRDLEMRELGWTHDGMKWINVGELYDPLLEAVVINWYLECEAPFNPDLPNVVQLEPCHHYPAEIHFDFKQEAEECHTYIVGFLVDAIQWNMDYEWGIP